MNFPPNSAPSPSCSSSPRISILIPCHNTAPYLEETVESVLAQSFKDWELILLDDGSTDTTPALLADFQRLDPRIRTHSGPRHGLVDTRNELLKMARGEFLSWHDSDDLMAPRRLEWQVERLAEDPALVWIGGACTLTDPEGLPIRTHAFPADHDAICRIMEEEIGCYFGSTLMRKSAAERVGGFRHPFLISEDFDLVLRMSEIGRVTNLPQVVLFYRQHMYSTVNAHRPRSFAYSRLATQLARERRTHGTDRLQRSEPVAVDFGELPSDLENQIETHRRWAWWALMDGHVQTARKYAQRALRMAPWQLESWKLFACAMRGH